MSRPTQIVPGQRWASEAEPELGLGVVRGCEFGRVELEFPAAGERRLFALSSAPLRRIAYAAGDAIELRDGRRLTVETVEEAHGLLTYQTARGPVPESELADTIRFAKPEERLLGGVVDELEQYRLRVESLRQRAALRRSPLRGFLGARIELLPHQIATAQTIARRARPRVLLADEVGLGKTVEACLVVHRLLLTGRASRVLIVVPESLVHQWFVELLRRFNLSFSLFDAERFISLRRMEPEANPFHDAQWVLASQDFLVSDPKVTAAALAGDWDVLVVDEAHHLEWSPKDASPAYRLVEALAAQVPALLLLTATPEQLGADGHFARLRLLDPDRYEKLDTFAREAEGYQAVADLVEAIEAWPRERITRDEFAHLARRADADERLLTLLDNEASGTVETVASRVIDAFGPGRVLFRCTRAALGGFPRREAILHPLRPSENFDAFTARVRWLAGLLGELAGEKILVITHRRADAERIVEALQTIVRVDTGLFHEGMTLLQRDRQAAYFADPEGARLLICSEIGSEGRNFQFAHHLVLFDLPTEPELLEQRIGRLDRIGQTDTIHLHIPFVLGTRDEARTRWYHEGLDAFETCLPAGHDFGSQFGPRIDALAESPDTHEVDRLVADATVAANAFRARLSSGRDRLLGMHAEARHRAEAFIARLQRAERPQNCEHFVVRLLDACGLVVEELAPHRYRIAPGVLTAEAFPGLPPEGFTVTFDRREAVSREDFVFFSADHPLVAAAFDAWLGGETGNSSFALWGSAPQEGMYLEVWFVVEAVAPRELHLDRFLPPTPVRVVVNHGGEPIEGEQAWDESELLAGDPGPLLERGVVKRKLLPAMLDAARAIGERAAAKIVAEARRAITEELGEERSRLELLARLNDHVRPDEPARLAEEETALLAALETASAQPDALRLVWGRSA